MVKVIENPNVVDKPDDGSNQFLEMILDIKMLIEGWSGVKQQQQYNLPNDNPNDNHTYRILRMVLEKSSELKVLLAKPFLQSS